jgi:hypothetical protein
MANGIGLVFPETIGRSLEDMNELFDGSHRPRFNSTAEEPYHDEDDESDATIAGTEQRRHELMPLYTDREE